MLDNSTIHGFHGQLLRDTFGSNISDRDAFLLFLLFHQFQIELAGPVLTDRPKLAAADRIAAITQWASAGPLPRCGRGARIAVPTIRIGTSAGTASGAPTPTPKSHQDELARLRDLTALLKKHPFAKRLVPEE
jgi:hypothetical protein